jgi:hypothetical protein
MAAKYLSLDDIVLFGFILAKDIKSTNALDDKDKFINY